MRRVLVIEDDQDIAQLVKLHLSDEGCDVELVHEGRTGLAAAESGRYDLIVLDLMLPGLDGLSICRAVRATSAYVPILMLTSKSSEIDRVLGLELGADDYLTKPFSIRELVARVRALFRRMELVERPAPEAPQAALRVGDMVIEVDKRQVSVGGKRVDLTAREFDLLLHFARHPGRVFTRTQLLDQVWGYGHDGYEHTVNSHINRLRAKVEQDAANPGYILTVWGVGYKFRDADGATD